MIKRKGFKPVRLHPDTWTVEDDVHVNGHHLTWEPAVYFKVTGEQGVFRFVSYTHNTSNDKEWITGVGGVGAGTKNPVKEFRSFRPERVRGLCTQSGGPLRKARRRK